MNAPVRRRHVLLVLLAMIALASLASARPGFYEYWKAGTKRKRAASTQPQTRESTRNQGAAPREPAREKSPEPWSADWFSNSKLIGEHLAVMTAAIREPLIGERFPLPRGGGFACSRVETGKAIGRTGLVLAIECSGPQLGGERRNEFYAPSEAVPPTLERVRWSIPARDSLDPSRWRAVVSALRDSLSGAMGPPAGIAEEEPEVRWELEGYVTSVRLHGSSTRVDSLVVRSESNRLNEGRASSP